LKSRWVRGNIMLDNFRKYIFIIISFYSCGGVN